MTIQCGKLRHFCESPVCPDPFWKLSICHRLRINNKLAT